MPRKALRDLTPGMILSEPVISESGNVLLERYTELSLRAISLLTIWDIDYVSIAGDRVQGETVPSRQIQSQPISSYEEFIEKYTSIVNETTATFDVISGYRRIPVQEIKEIAFNIYATVLSAGPAVMNYLLVNEHHLADKIVQHSIMVAFLSSLIGRQFKLLSNEVNSLVLGALLHDIGKLVVTKGPEISGKNAHIVNGGQLVIGVSDMPQEVLHSVLQHHECLDGSGFPLGVREEKIHLYARIVSVANIFHNSAYEGGRFNPFPAIDRLSVEMFDTLDPCVCHSFVTNLRESLINTPVLLSNGEVAQVAYFNPSHHNIMVKTAQGDLLDVGAQTGISIQHVVTGG